MTKRPKRPRDPAQLAKLMIDIASGEVEEHTSVPPTAASEFARQGGLKGGAARARKLSQSERSAIAKKAARARWQKSQTAPGKKEPV